MMFLSRLELKQDRIARQWLSNPYRVHQRLCMACEKDPRILFRVEESHEGPRILVQSQVQPNWQVAFKDFPVLVAPPQWKPFNLNLVPGAHYHFRLSANPTKKHCGKRQGLMTVEQQTMWLERKLKTAGATLLGCRVTPTGFAHSKKTSRNEVEDISHFSVVYDGTLQVQDARLLEDAIRSGIGSAKGFGFGLLSLAPALS